MALLCCCRSRPISQSNAISNCLLTPVQETHLCGGLDLGQSLALLEALLLLEAHDLEALEVAKSAPPGDLLTLLGPVRLLPLGVDLRVLPLLLQLGVASATGKAFDDEGREESPGEAQGLAGAGELGVGRGALDKNLNRQLLSVVSRDLREPWCDIRACGR